MVDYGKAIKRPFTDIKKLVIGIVLSYIPIVNFISLGYILNSAKSATKGINKLPEWKDWGSLFIKGLIALIISVIYMIPAGIVFLLTIGGAFYSGRGTAGMASMGVGGIVAVVLYFLAMYLLPVALIRYITKDSFGAAFNMGTIVKKVLSVEYLVPWVLLSIYSGVLVGILGVISFGLLQPLAVFITSLTLFSGIGEIYPDL